MARSLYFTDRKEYYRRLGYTGKLDPKSIRRFRKKVLGRTRKQVVLNSDYNISIRAIVINGTQTEQDLKNKIQEVLSSNPELTQLPFDYSGFEVEKLDAYENRGLEHGKIHVELNVRGETTTL